MQCLRRALGRHRKLAFAIADQFGETEYESKRAGRQTPHGDHQGKPAGVAVWPLSSDSAEDGDGEQGSDCSGEEDHGAGPEELASVWLHCH